MTDVIFSPILAGIRLYPVKGLDGIAVSRARLLAGGALEYDRRWKIEDAATGEKVNGKREPKVHTLRAAFDLDALTVTLRRERDPVEAGVTFSLGGACGERVPLQQWLSDYFERPVRVLEDDERGFPDDPKRPGPTLISQATLETVAAWFPGVDAAEILRRMRTNMVIGGMPAFWEDSLYCADEADGGAGLAFGAHPAPLLEAVNPCLRCIVPARDARTGEPTENFATEFIAHRLAALPDGVARERFEKPFRLAVNTLPAPDSRGGSLSVGDAIRIERSGQRRQLIDNAPQS